MVVSVELDAREVEWRFARDRTIRAFAYNGVVPGPLIETEVGDTVEARLTNSLPQATTIHWHGVRVPAHMDGTEAVQPPVEPGGAFEYRFVVPDAGTFWYHSHTNETEQLERGLYGGLIVRDPGEPDFDSERVLILDDLKLDAEGEIAPFGDEHEHHAGREGEVRLLNGALEPELEIEVLLTPGERFDLAVGPFEEGERLEIEALPYDRGKGESERERFATLRVGAAVASCAEVPATLRPIDPLVEPDVEPTRTISLKALMHEGHDQRADPVRVGELQVWELVNETGQDHPFHIHGFFFQVVQENGRTPPEVAWKDTVNVPRKSQTTIAWLPDDRPGEWMYHCHILEHHAMGMMAHFSVVP
ncbi:MAG: multicopper oxidase family protein [Actinobacteria bacterium]|nr:MAG: multicopper oxidase family protein [Actinomycetota bacterium]